MSPASVSSFVHDLVTMAQATEQLPQLQAECERLKTEVEAYAQQVQRLELKLLARNDDIDGLNSRIRSLEVERDDASFRELEAIDKVDAVKSVVESIQAQAETLKEKLYPKPVEVREEVDPTGAPQVGSQEGTPSRGEPQPVKIEDAVELPKASDWVPSQGQSDVDPTALTASSTSETAPMPTASEPSSASEPKGPYASRYYIDYPGWISREDWKAGGGTDASYDYRRGSDSF